MSASTNFSPSMGPYAPARRPSQDASQPLQQGIANSTPASAYRGTPSSPHQQAGTTSFSAASASGTPSIFDCVFKITVKPHNRSELPKMRYILRRIDDAHRSVTTKVGVSGEYVVLGKSEVRMTFVRDDLRRFCADTEIGVSDPVAYFYDTVEAMCESEHYAPITTQIAASANVPWPLGLSVMPPGYNNHMFSCCQCVAAGREVREEHGGGLCPTCRHHQCPKCNDRELRDPHSWKAVRFAQPMGAELAYKDPKDPLHLGHWKAYHF